MLNIQFMQQSPLTVKIHHFLHKTFRILTSYDQSLLSSHSIYMVNITLQKYILYLITRTE